MGDEEDKENMFQEAAKRAWVRVFIREASKRGYPIENIVALLDEPGMTAEAVVERVLSTREPKPIRPPRWDWFSQRPAPACLLRCSADAHSKKRDSIL